MFLFDKIENFNNEVIHNFSLENKELINYLENNKYDDIFYNVCNNLKELILNVRRPFDNLSTEDQYNKDYLNKYKQSIELVLNKFSGYKKEDIFNLSKIWFTRTQTPEELNKSIQIDYNRILTDPKLINWNYIKDNI